MGATQEIKESSHALCDLICSSCCPSHHMHQNESQSGIRLLNASLHSCRVYRLLILMNDRWGEAAQNLQDGPPHRTWDRSFKGMPTCQRHRRQVILASKCPPPPFGSVVSPLTVTAPVANVRWQGVDRGTLPEGSPPPSPLSGMSGRGGSHNVAA